MRINDAGLKLIQEFEGYHKRLPDGSCVAYLDKLAGKKYWSPGYNGLWTIGYGCTEGVTEGMVWSKAQAVAALRKEVAKHEQAVSKMLRVAVDPNEFSALVSLSYNIGSGALSRSSIIKKLNKGDRKGAADAFLLYNKAGGKVYAGLVRRRKAERTLFLKWTKKDVVEGSRKLTLLQWLRRIIAGTGLGAYFSWDTLEQLSGHAVTIGWTLLGVGVGAFVLFKVIEALTLADFEEGRYIPSGMEDEDA